MYSVINVDVSAETTDFLMKEVIFRAGYIHEIAYKHQAIIRGSSTVNGDSAHDTDPLAKEHNYVSFYIRSIKIKYEIINVYNQPSAVSRVPGYVILFKFPYKDDEDVRDKLISTMRIDSMVLYSHPECILTYSVINVRQRNVGTSCFLNYNKPFVVRPNDYVGIFYFFPTSFISSDPIFSVSATAKVVFKPL